MVRRDPETTGQVGNRALEQVARVQEELGKRLAEYGINEEAFWESPLEHIEAAATARMMELLAKEKMSDQDRIAAIRVAHQVHSLAKLQEGRAQRSRSEAFSQRFGRDGEKPVVVEVVKGEEKG
jgi:hypothetical protein